MRFVFGKVAALAVASVLATTAVVGCSSNPDNQQAENLGAVGMHLKVGPGITLDAVTLTVTDTAHADPVMVRTIPAPGNGSDFNFAVSLPPSPAGGHYHAHLEAHTTAPHAVTCLGDADFTVAAGQTASASITLVCDDDLVNGDQKFAVTVDSRVCPLYVDFASTSPTTVQANGGIATLSGTAHDETQTPQTSGFTYAWSAPAGSGTITDASPLDGNATFACGNPNNNVVLTLTATRLDQGCSDSISVNVNCASALCGNGTLDPGETCDDGNTIDTDSCPADCTFACGDGKREGNEQCDPPDGLTCGTLNGVACQLLPYCGDHTVNQTSEQCDDGNTVDGDGCEHNCKLPVCGNGIKDTVGVTPAEQCDDGNQIAGDGCENNCTTTPMAGICGDSIVGNATGGTDECDFGPAPTGPGKLGFCTSTCKLENRPDCVTCENANVDCAPLVGACDALTGTVTAGLRSGAQKSVVCNEVLECVRRTNCGKLSNTDCFCGIGANTADCLLGTDSITGGDFVPTGPCQTEIRGGLNMSATTGSTTALTRYTDRSFAGGIALARMSCDRSNCAGGVAAGTEATTQCFALPPTP